MLPLFVLSCVYLLKVSRSHSTLLPLPYESLTRQSFRLLAIHCRMPPAVTVARSLPPSLTWITSYMPSASACGCGCCCGRACCEAAARLAPSSASSLPLTPTCAFTQPILVDFPARCLLA